MTTFKHDTIYDGFYLYAWDDLLDEETVRRYLEEKYCMPSCRDSSKSIRSPSKFVSQYWTWRESGERTFKSFNLWQRFEWYRKAKIRILCGIIATFLDARPQTCEFFTKRSLRWNEFRNMLNVFCPFLKNVSEHVPHIWKPVVLFWGYTKSLSMNFVWAKYDYCVMITWHDVMVNKIKHYFNLRAFEVIWVCPDFRQWVPVEF